MYRFDDHLRVSHRGWIYCRAPPGHVQRQPREIDDAAVAAVAAQVVRGPHENAIHRARLNAQRTEHALGVVDRVARNLKALAALDPFLADVNAIHRTGLRTLVAGDACSE